MGVAYCEAVSQLLLELEDESEDNDSTGDASIFGDATSGKEASFSRTTFTASGWSFSSSFSAFPNTSKKDK